MRTVICRCFARDCFGVLRAWKFNASYQAQLVLFIVFVLGINVGTATLLNHICVYEISFKQVDQHTVKSTDKAVLAVLAVAKAITWVKKLLTVLKLRRGDIIIVK